MLHSSRRLSGEQLDLVMRVGIVRHTPYFWLRFVKNDGQTRISAIVPQKLINKSSGRVNYRRKMYDAVSTFYESINPGYLIVLCLKVKVDDSLLIKETKEIFVKAGLLK